MFEKASELRARYRVQAIRKAVERGKKEGMTQGKKEGIKQIDARWKAAVERYGIEVDGVKTLPITPEVQRFLDGEEG